MARVVAGRRLAAEHRAQCLVHPGQGGAAARIVTRAQVVLETVEIVLLRAAPRVSSRRASTASSEVPEQPFDPGRIAVSGSASLQVSHPARTHSSTAW